MTDSSLDRRGFCGLAATAAVWLASAGARPGRTAGFVVNHTDAEWKRVLGPARFEILREGGTEKPFSSPLLNEHRKGTFLCAGCANPLFSSATKFDSGTGWPSFWRALPHAVVTRIDRSLLMERTEVRCARCGSHLGHVFHDGPKPTGLRYCMDGLALRFTSDAA